MASRTSALAIPIMIGLLPLGLLSACKSTETEPFDRVFLVTIDTLRADHVGSHGYPRRTSVFLDQMASGGVQFLAAFSSIPTTAPAHASIFTALHPFEHNLLKNGERLDGSLLNVAELFRRAGFHTAAFTSVTFLRWGLRAGFDSFDAANTEGRKYRIASETIDRVLEWLGDKTSRDKFLLWVHLFDPHEHWKDTPPPPRYLAEMAIQTDSETKEFLDFLSKKHQFPKAKARVDSPAANTILRYDAQILFVDRELERLFNFAEDKGLAEESLWIVTSDHGEGLGNHGYWLHGEHLYNEQLHVPLIFYSPRKGFPRRRISRLVRHIDVLPTIADLMRLPLEPDGYEISGRSLRPLMEGETGDLVPSLAFSQRRPKDKDRPAFEDGDVYAIQGLRFKYIHQSQGRSQFYDLEKDPLELENHIDNASTEKDRLADLLARDYAPRFHSPIVSGKPAPELDEATREELRALGYIQ